MPRRRKKPQSDSEYNPLSDNGGSETSSKEEEEVNGEYTLPRPRVLTPGDLKAFDFIKKKDVFNGCRRFIAFLKANTKDACPEVFFILLLYFI